MTYPSPNSDASELFKIRVGDLIWWNEGVCVGFVEKVLEKPCDYERCGLNEPGIALSILHPYEANQKKHTQHTGSFTSGGTVIYSAKYLEDEGIGMLAPSEQSELNWAIEKARSMVSEFLRSFPFCVSAMVDTAHGGENWHFHFVDNECRIIETAIFPLRPNTRS